MKSDLVSGLKSLSLVIAPRQFRALLDKPDELTDLLIGAAFSGGDAFFVALSGGRIAKVRTARDRSSLNLSSRGSRDCVARPRCRR
jgi:hypothetical protein